jgi:hypothetical protein
LKIDSQKIKKHSTDLALLLCVIGTLSGCSAVKSGSSDVKALTVEPAPNAGFIEQPDQQVKRADLPFQKVWIKPGFEKSGYRELIVAPVNTQYMFEMDWLHKASTANWFGGVQKDIEELAQYFHDQVVKDFKEDPKRRFQVIASPAQHKQKALRLELALVEIDPSMPVLHAAGWAVIGGSTAAGVVNQRRAAFEGRLRDLQTGEVVATFADRDMQDVGPIDMTRMTWYGPAKGIMAQWAKQFVQIANRKPGEVITDPTAFTLKPF